MLRAFLFKGKDKHELIGQVVNILVWKRMLVPPFLRAGCDRKKETYSGIDMGKKMTSAQNLVLPLSVCLTVSKTGSLQCSSP